MVEIKVDTDEILFRIVFAGRERATKFANLRALQGAFAGQVTQPMIVMHAGGDRVIGFDLPVADEDRLFGMKVRIEVIARPGVRQSLANDVLLHRSADAIVWLDDRDSDDDGGAPAEFEHLLADLERLGRKAGDLPIFVQCYSDAAAERRRLYQTRGRAWKPVLEVVGQAGVTELDVFAAARKAVFAAYRRYERDLARAGLSDHVKIRDRVYERLSTTPVGSPADGNKEMRLIRSRGPRTSRVDRLGSFLLFLVLVATVAVALWLSIIL